MSRSRTLAAAFTLVAFAAGPMGCGATSRDRGHTDPIGTVDPGGGGTGSGAVTDPIEVVHRPRGAAKPLGESVEKGLRWLAKQQLAGGGWGQGDEAPGMGHHMAGST